MQGSQSREAEYGAGIRRPKEARRGDDEEAAGGRITGKTEWAEDEAGEREREIRGEAVESPSLSLSLAAAVVDARVDSKWCWCVVVVIHRGGSRHRATLGKTGEERIVEEQPEAALTRSSGGEERQLATLSRTGSLARNEAALDKDESGNGPRRGWRSRGAGCTERDEVRCTGEADRGEKGREKRSWAGETGP